MWFLKQYEELHFLKIEISGDTIDKLPRELLLEAKQKGYGDFKLHTFWVVMKVKFIRKELR